MPPRLPSVLSLRSIARMSKRPSGCWRARPATYPPWLACAAGSRLSRRDAQTAWHHFRIAFQSDPEDRETVFGLVYALELAGQSKAAGPFRELAGKLDRLSTLIHRAALRKARQDATLLRQLGDACAALHRDPEARAWYEQAIALDFQDSEAQRALYRLRDPARAARPVPPALPESISQAARY